MFKIFKIGIILLIGVLIFSCSSTEFPDLPPPTAQNSSSSLGSSSSNGLSSSSSDVPSYESSSSNNSSSSMQSSSSFKGTCPIAPNPNDIAFVDPRDGKAYKYELLHNEQIWMMENLDYSANGTLGWCYGTGMDMGIQGAEGPGCANGYGRTYDWPSTNICPEGWEVPTRADWTSAFGTIAARPPADFYILAGNYNLNSMYPPLGWAARGSFGFYWTSEANDFFALFAGSSGGSINSTATSDDRFSVRCVASATAMPKCNGIEYNLETHFCHEGMICEN
ncbi:MAG: hypothetical protein LBC85_11575 [Fibromonadaceae bacterium]|jgi:hypothetical protein|nr:hypothetical protein [Fibromonadaceae bacterium]